MDEYYTHLIGVMGHGSFFHQRMVMDYYRFFCDIAFLLHKICCMVQKKSKMTSDHRLKGIKKKTDGMQKVVNMAMKRFWCHFCLVACLLDCLVD